MESNKYLIVLIAKMKNKRFAFIFKTQTHSLKIKLLIFKSFLKIIKRKLLKTFPNENGQRATKHTGNVVLKDLKSQDNFGQFDGNMF